MSDQPPSGYPPPQPPGGYQPPQPQQPAYQPPAAPQAPPPGGYQPPAQQPGGYQAAPPGQFQPVNPAPSSNNGCLKAFLIVLGISVVLGIIVVIGSIVLVGSAVDQAIKTFGPASPSDYDIKIDKCEVNSDSLIGEMKATGTIENKAGRKQAYNITIDFNSTDNTKLATDSLIYTGSLDAGQKATFSATGFPAGDPPSQISCKVKEVNYWGS